MGKRIAAKFKPSGITTILESDDSRVKPLIGEQRADLLADAFAKILLSCGARGTLPNPIARGTLRHRRRANPRGETHREESMLTQMRGLLSALLLGLAIPA